MNRKQRRAAKSGKSNEARDAVLGESTVVVDPRSIAQWHKRQDALEGGDHGLIVTGYDDDLGMLPGWVRVLSREGSILRVRVTAPGRPLGLEVEYEETLRIERVLPVSPEEFAASTKLASGWRDPWAASPLKTNINMKLGAFFDQNGDGTFYAKHRELRPARVSLSFVWVGASGAGASK